MKQPGGRETETERAPARRRFVDGRGRAWTIAGVGLALAALFGGLRATAAVAEAAPAPPLPTARESAPRVLVELFTSEGCSSCPPADDAIRELARSQPVPGAFVVVLAHHVDYWNDLGWPDPFSSADATARQKAYMHLGGRLYTPQAVVDGSAQLVGSREGAIEKAIAAAAKRPHARIDVEVTAPPARGAFDVLVKIASLPDGAVDPELLVAVVQDRASITIARGENAGRTLEHVGIARSVKALGPIAAGASPRTQLEPPAAIGAPPNASFSVVAFVQERSSRRVLGTAAAGIRAPAGP